MRSVTLFLGIGGSFEFEKEDRDKVFLEKFGE
jgi:hypothetical protein